MSSLRPLDAPYLPESRWTLADAFLALVAGFVAVALLGWLFFALTGIEATGLAVLMVTLVIQAMATVATLLFLGRRRGGGSFPVQVGLEWRWRDGWGIVAGVVLQVVVAVVVGNLVRLLPGEPTQQAVVEVASTVPRGAMLVVLFVLLAVVAPVVEEIVYRGVLLSRLRRSMRPWPAILASAAAFAAVHLVDPAALYAVPGLFLIGVALGWFALSAGNLGLPIAAHAGVNLTGVLVLTFVDDLAGTNGEVSGVIAGVFTGLLGCLPG